MRVGNTETIGTWEIQSTAPYITTHNTTEEDGAGGRESKWIARGEQVGGAETVLGEIEISHDGTSDDEKGKLIIRLNDGSDGASPTDVLTALSSGNVGIGTSSPAAKLEVAGTTVTTIATVKTTTGLAAFSLANDGGAAGLYIDNSAATSFARGAYSRNLYSYGAYPLIFWTNDLERMRIDSSGNIYTPDADTYASFGRSRIGYDGTNSDVAPFTHVDAATGGMAVDNAGYTTVRSRFGANGVTPAAKQTHVADPAGGSTVDAEARSAINAILATLETFGFHATS